MNSILQNRNWSKASIICTIALASGFATVHSAYADEWNKKTVITINQPIQIYDTYLEPGTYVLKLVDSSSDRHIVRIMDADEKHVVNTMLAIPNYRLTPTGKSRFQFWETPAGSVHALRAWFYPGDNFGQEFQYPKSLRQIAIVTSSRSTVIETPNPIAEESSASAVVEEPTPAPVVAAVEPAPEPAPVPEPAAVVAEESTATATQLPKTATYAPALGLSGLLAFGLYSLLRLRRA